MKLILMTMAICLLPARADILLDIMNGVYQEPLDITDDCDNEESDSSEAEHYSWDNLYLCTYCYDTEVIIDPYRSENEVGFSY